MNHTLPEAISLSNAPAARWEDAMVTPKPIIDTDISSILSVCK